MNISGLLIHAQPERAEHVRTQIEQLSGVEVHAATADGRLIVTVEKGDDQDMPQLFEQLGAIPGVLATTLVYHHSETLEDESPANKESMP
ncbi:MAG: chaperone NapD [Pseudomonadota bacterium]